jgi:hypothetical protein
MMSEDQLLRTHFEEIMESANNEQKLLMISILAHNITVGVRVILQEFTTARESLYNLNEIQHQITNRLMNLLSKEDEWEEKEFVENIYSYAKDGNCLGELNYAIKIVCKYVEN